MGDRLVVGRVVALDEGRPIIQTLPSPPDPRIAALIAAARAYKAKPDAETEATLLQAARRLD